MGSSVLAGLVLTALAFIASTVSFVAPFWFKEGPKEDKGLWASCKDGGDCEWFWENDFKAEKQLHDWYKATQGLFAFGVVTLFIAFLFGCIHLCCGCFRKVHMISYAIATLLIFAFILITIALVVFGVQGNKVMDIELKKSESDIRTFLWGYWVGVAGDILTLIAAILYSCTTMRGGGYSGYTRGEVV